MTPIQIILLLTIGFIITKVWQKYRERTITIREFFLWVFFWLCVTGLILFPGSTQALATLVGIGRGADLVIYGALMVLFSALFFILVRIERMERNITHLARKMALGEVRKKKDGEHKASDTKTDSL